MTIAILNWSSLSAEQRRQALRRPAQQEHARVAGARAARSSAKCAPAATPRCSNSRDASTASRLTAIEVSAAEFAAAETALDSEQRTAIDRAIANVRRFHEAQIGDSAARGDRARRRLRASLPIRSMPSASTFRPASPPCPPPRSCSRCRRESPAVRRESSARRRAADGTADPAVLTIANLCGVRRVFKLGGAQAIAAMAYGTAERAEGRQGFRSRQFLGHGRKAAGRERSRRRGARSSRRPVRSSRDRRCHCARRVRRGRPAGASRTQRRCAGCAGHDVERARRGDRGAGRDADAKARPRRHAAAIDRARASVRRRHARHRARDQQHLRARAPDPAGRECARLAAEGPQRRLRVPRRVDARNDGRLLQRHQPRVADLWLRARLQRPVAARLRQAHDGPGAHVRRPARSRADCDHARDLEGLDAHANAVQVRLAQLERGRA